MAHLEVPLAWRLSSRWRWWEPWWDEWSRLGRRRWDVPLIATVGGGPDGLLLELCEVHGPKAGVLLAVIPVPVSVLLPLLCGRGVEWSGAEYPYVWGPLR